MVPLAVPAPVSHTAHAFSYWIPSVTTELIELSPPFLAEETIGSEDVPKCHRI